MRQIAPVALVLTLTVAGFISARMLAQGDVRHDADRRAEVAAAQIRSRMAQAASLTESLRRFMLDAGGTGVTSDQFARTAVRWLNPASFPAAAWVERVPDSGRPAYQRRLGQPIVTPDVAHSVVPAGARSSYVAATLVSGFPPLALTGIDLSRERGMAAALDRSTRLDRVIATDLSGPGTGLNGLFLVAPASNLVAGRLRPGHVVVFVPEKTLHAAAESAPSVRITAGPPANAPSKAAHRTFSAADQRFDVVVPRGSAHGAGALLSWIVLAAGLVLAALAAALGVIAARRARAKEELDRIFTLSPDLIAVADFDGHFTRVNPAASEILGYTEEELVERRYLDLVHPEDREQTAAEAAAIVEGKTTVSFENRYVRKDGSERVLEWTTKPVVEDRVMYGVARDVTERRQAEREQAALRRVATLVAEAAAPSAILDAVAGEMQVLLGADQVALNRFEPDAEIVVLAHRGLDVNRTPVGSRMSHEGENVTSIVRRTGSPARMENYEEAGGTLAELARATGLRASVSAPITVEGRVWGVVTASWKGDESPPADTEDRMAKFAHLIDTAIANTEARREVERLAEEQAALRRVATLVARGASRRQVFNAIAAEVRQLLGADFIDMLRYEDDRTAVTVASGGWAVEVFAVGSRHELGGDNGTSRIFRTGQPVRIDDYHRSATGPIAEAVRATGIRSVVGTPLVVDDRLWGAVTIGTAGEDPLPPDTEARLGQFTELMSTAIANTESRAEVERLAAEQVALRRVATMVAVEASQGAVFAAIAEEIGRLLGEQEIRMLRYEGNENAVVVAASGAQKNNVFPVALRVPLGGSNAASRVFLTGEAVRIDDYRTATGPIAESVRPSGLRSVVATPIVVEGRRWGAMVVGTMAEEPLPSDTESRLDQFTALMATAIANAEAHTEIERLAEEQAALRRVATLVAGGVPPEELFAAVAEEVGLLMSIDGTRILRYETDDTATVVARWSERVEVPPELEIGVHVALEADTVTSRVYRSGRPARIDADQVTGPLAAVIRRLDVPTGAGAPIVVDGRLWGVMVIGSLEGGPLPPGAEDRLAQFTELVATAIANTESRTALAVLADEQATLRRMATLVARGLPPADIFSAVSQEASRLVGSDTAAVVRFEHDPPSIVVVGVGQGIPGIPIGTRSELDDGLASTEVYRTGRSARIDRRDWALVGGPLDEPGRRAGLSSTVASPISVAGRLWGTLSVSAKAPLPLDTEERLEQFSVLVATAIANAENRSELAASRARIVAASDEARRRIERDLHDGVQQELVSLGLELRAVRADPPDGDALEAQLARVSDDVGSILDSLVEIARGIHPSILSQGGLAAALGVLARRSAVPVELNAQIVGSLRDEVEVAAYYVVSEALTNVAKYARASVVHINLTRDNEILTLVVRDDGVGGADPGKGSGLVGLRDRVEALGGTIELDSSAGKGTVVVVTLPVATEPDQEMEDFLVPRQTL